MPKLLADAIFAVLSCLEIRSVTNVEVIDERLVVADLPDDACWLPRELSSRMGGAFYPHCTCVNAEVGAVSLSVSKGPYGCVVMDRRLLNPIRKIREAAQAICGEPCPWSASAICGKLLSWAAGGKTGPPAGKAEIAAAKPPKIGFQRCLPGSYPDIRHTDIRRAYWQALGRLPSPSVSIANGRPVWHPLSPDQLARWRDVLIGVEELRPLRLSLHGCMLPGYSPSEFWKGGVLCRAGLRPGFWAVGALLAQRAIYELVSEQALCSSSPYANTDCVFLRSGDRPDVWDRAGYQWRDVSVGDCEVLALGNYRVGARETRWYGNIRTAAAYTGDPAVERPLYPLWH